MAAIPKNLYVNIFCTSWQICMIKLSSMRFFKGAEFIGRGFEMTGNRDHAKFKMSAILLHQSLFLVTSRLLKMTQVVHGPELVLVQHPPPFPPPHPTTLPF